jgi:hypothetical protein
MDFEKAPCFQKTMRACARQPARIEQDQKPKK